MLHYHYCYHYYDGHYYYGYYHSYYCKWVRRDLTSMPRGGLKIFGGIPFFSKPACCSLLRMRRINPVFVQIGNTDFKFFLGVMTGHMTYMDHAPGQSVSHCCCQTMTCPKYQCHFSTLMWSHRPLPPGQEVTWSLLKVFLDFGYDIILKKKQKEEEHSS